MPAQWRRGDSDDEQPLAEVIPLPVRPAAAPDEAPPKVITLPANQVIRSPERQPTRSMRAARFLQRRWAQLPAHATRETAIVAVFAGAAVAATTVLSPFGVFGFTLVARILFYLVYSLRVEIDRFEAKVAARSLAYMQVFAYTAATIALTESNAMWRYPAYVVLVLALTMEIHGVRTWYTEWVIHDRDTGDPPFNPKGGSLIGAYAWIMAEYVALLLLGFQLMDEIVLFTYHATVWMITHPVESLIFIGVAAVIIVVTKVYIVIIWMFANPISILGIMLILGVIGIATS